MLSIISDIYYSHLCDPHQNDPIKNYFHSELRPLFMFLTYSPVTAVFGKFINICTTFLWSYMDLFVMMIGVGLSSRFKQINECLMSRKGKVSSLYSNRFESAFSFLIRKRKKHSGTNIAIIIEVCATYAKRSTKSFQRLRLFRLPTTFISYAFSYCGVLSMLI